MRIKVGLLSFILSIIFLHVPVVQGAEPVVAAKKILKAPVIDGNDQDWTDIKAVAVRVAPAVNSDNKNHTGTIDVTIKAANDGENIYFLVQWPDDTKDDTHKVMIWNSDVEMYEAGNDLEDRLALGIDMGGDFTGCMLGGTEYKADIWHWKAFRSQTAGIAHDKMHIVSFQQMPMAKKHASRDGKKEVWIARPSDAGDKLYKSQRLIDKKADREPKYLVTPSPQGSIADVKTGAVWADSTWTLEIKRKLSTGHVDDVVFVPGEKYKASVAVFNHTGDDHHSKAAFTLKIQ